MTEADVLKIEEELAVSLPDAYRSILLNYPDELLKLAEILKTDEICDPETPADLELLNDPDSLIENNRFVRTPGHRYSKSGAPWPASYFLIGIDGCGDYYAIDLQMGDESPVFFWGHEMMEWDEHAPNIREFIPQLVEQYYDFAREEGLIKQPASSSPKKHASSKKLEKLASIITSESTCFDFFQTLYLKYAKNGAGSLLHTFEDGRVNVVINGPEFDDAFMDWLLELPGVEKYFKDIKELRFAGSRVSISKARTFKRLNKDMFIYHVTYDDLMNFADNYTDDPAWAKSDMDKFGLSPIAMPTPSQ